MLRPMMNLTAEALFLAQVSSESQAYNFGRVVGIIVAVLLVGAIVLMLVKKRK